MVYLYLNGLWEKVRGNAKTFCRFSLAMGGVLLAGGIALDVLGILKDFPVLTNLYSAVTAAALGVVLGIVLLTRLESDLQDERVYQFTRDAVEDFEKAIGRLMLDGEGQPFDRAKAVCTNEALWSQTFPAFLCGDELENVSRTWEVITHDVAPTLRRNGRPTLVASRLAGGTWILQEWQRHCTENPPPWVSADDRDPSYCQTTQGSYCT
ncbi:hypothetical protein [Streptomyces bullii]|uniref:SMODS and SLOG-associating 2TM effector domain-containing protein n=1 Tax=Streptomyces bullii TaxID=349910 RepID=A0ABW0V4B2_9ACTN